MKFRTGRQHFALIAVIAMTGTLLSTAGAASASDPDFALSASARDVAPGTVAAITANFVAKDAAPGNYILDTEIWKGDTRLAQWFETRYVDAREHEVVKHSWNTSGQTAGTYRIRTGVFTPGWSSNVAWSDESPTFEITKGSGVTTGAVTTSGNIATVTATVTSATSGKRIVDIEIYDANQNKVGQKFGTMTFAGSAKPVRASFDLSGRTGPFRAKIGIFSENWVLDTWTDSVATFELDGTSQAPAPTTTVPKASTPPTTQAPTAPPVETPSAPVSAAGSSFGNPFAGQSLYADPNVQALQVAAQLRQQGRTADAAVIERIGKTPAAIWLGGWSGDIKTTVSRNTAAAQASGKMPVFIAYNIPNRDCGSYSAGGASDAGAYRTWISQLAAGIGDSKVAVIVEPDALPGIDCLSAQGQADRYAMINYAVTVLSANENTAVYLDAGNFSWQNAGTMNERLKKAGVSKARGFSLNVSGFGDTASTTKYGDELAGLLGGKHYVVDTSRNGNGSNGEWCNPSGRKLGAYPTVNTGGTQADAFLWLKTPGESDGTCNGGPSAGTFWLEYALGLAR